MRICCCKARRFAEALRSSWFFNFALFFCFRFFLVSFAVKRTVSVFTAKDLFKKFDILPKSFLVLVVSEKELIADLSGLRKK